MRRSWWVAGLSSLALMAASAVGAPAAGAASSTASHLVGSWKLDQSSAGSGHPITDSAGSRDGYFVGYQHGEGTTVDPHAAPVGTSSGTSYQFPGWHGMSSSSAGYKVDAWAGAIGIPDGSSALAPGRVTDSGSTPAFSVRLSVNSDALPDPHSYPRWWSGTSFGHASPNIIQQGLAASSGQWKIAQVVSASSPSRYGLLCTFAGYANGHRSLTTRSVSTPSSYQMKVGNPYQVQCDLLPGGRPRLTVTPLLSSDSLGTQVVTSGAGSLNSFVVSPRDDVFVGKKCHRKGGASAVDHANDAFTGRVDNVSIYTS